MKRNYLCKVTLASILAVFLAVPAGAVAQDEKESETYIYASYFYCKVDGEEKADELVKKNTAPIFDAAVEDGTIKAWGWLSHHTGGKWRRIQFHSSDSVAGLLKAQEVLQQRAEEAGTANDGFASVCYAHDDYIWKSESGNALDADRGTAGLSVYHYCKISKEDRADEIVAKHFAPVYEKAMADGKIKSWGWSSHVVGGKYRKLGTMTADSFPELLKARGEILEAIYADGENAEAMEFAEICTSHSDYLWNIDHEKN